MDSDGPPRTAPEEGLLPATPLAKIGFKQVFGGG
jgi:hypothetical protein